MRLALGRGGGVEQRDHGPATASRAWRQRRVLVAVGHRRRERQRRRCRPARARATPRAQRPLRGAHGEAVRHHVDRHRPLPEIAQQAREVRVAEDRRARCAARWRSTSHMPSASTMRGTTTTTASVAAMRCSQRRRVLARRRADRRDLRGVGHRDPGHAARRAHRTNAPRSRAPSRRPRNVLSHVARYSKREAAHVQSRDDAQRQGRGREMQDARRARGIQRRLRACVQSSCERGQRTRSSVSSPCAARARDARPRATPPNARAVPARPPRRSARRSRRRARHRSRRSRRPAAAPASTGC